MFGRYKKTYRVDNVPPLLYPFYIAYSFCAGCVLSLYFILVYITSKIKYVGTRPSGRNFIYCLWHGSVLVYLTAFQRLKPHIWMNHPYWYMKPIHICIFQHGVSELILGSSGNSGKEAANKVIEIIKQGYYNTMVNPDGPEGPAQVLKRGILFMAMNANVPIVPLKFECHPCLRSTDWDHKAIPLPFSTIVVTFGEPILVQQETFDESQRALTLGLG